jgi:hypothetical protein
VRREWTPEDLIASWTLVEDDWRLIANKTGSTRLGFALLLKFFELEARFPRHAGEVPKDAIDYMAQQVKVEPGLFAQYAWSGRTIEYHRAQVRKALGFREPSVEDEARLGSWLAAEVCLSELGEERQREALLSRCREERLEPPGPSRLDRVLATGRAAAEQRFCAQTVERMSADAIERLEEVIFRGRRAPPPTTSGPRPPGCTKTPDWVYEFAGIRTSSGRWWWSRPG